MSSGTWGSREAAAEWQRGAAARLEALGTTGHALATDVSSSMLEVAAQSAERAGLNCLSTRVADAQQLDIESDSFDAVISRNCLMLIPDYQLALTEIRRVLKRGGRLAAIVYSTADRCPYFSIPHAIVFRVGRLTSPQLERFGEFKLAAPGGLEDAYATAGFRDVSVRPVATRRRFPSLADAMRFARGPLPLREIMARLSPSEQDQAWVEIERALAQFVSPTGYDSPCEVLIGAGTK